jgi:acyl carrier protein phosphodiesterase
VNFVAHVHVALAATGSRPDDADVAFGAALPDLASMAGFRIDRPALPEAVREGVSLHHRTDGVFHSLPEFTTGARRLGELLQARGLAVGPSRAIGHAGWELLLDGCLLDRSGGEERFARVLERAPDVAGSVSPANPGRWRGLVSDMRSDRWWLGYRDTDLVARRLQRLLRARRRLSFDVEQIPLVADALAAAKPDVDFAADRVMPAVIATLARDDRGG